MQNFELTIGSAKVSGRSSAQQLQPHLYLAFIFMVLVMVPGIQALFQFSILRWLALIGFIWLVMVFNRSYKRLIQSIFARKVELLLFAIWAVVVISYASINDELIYWDQNAGNVLKVFYHFVIVSLGYGMILFYSFDLDENAYGFIVNGMIILLGLNALISLQPLASGHLVAREFVNTNEFVDLYRENIMFFALGDISYYCLLTMIVIPVFFNSIDRKPLHFIFYLILLGGLVGNVILSSLLAPLVCLVVGVVCSLYMSFVASGSNTDRNRNMLILLFMLFFVIFTLRYNDALILSQQKVMTYFSSSYFETFEGYTMDKRRDMYLYSYDAFLQHPFVGIGLLKQDVSDIRLGGHSGLLDALGTYGIFAFSFIAFMVVRTIRLLRLSRIVSGDHRWRTGLVVTLVYFIFIIYDPVLISNRLLLGYILLTSVPVIANGQPLVYKKGSRIKGNLNRVTGMRNRPA